MLHQIVETTEVLSAIVVPKLSIGAIHSIDILVRAKGTNSGNVASAVLKLELAAKISH